MPHETGLISTITVALAFAFVGGFIAVRLRLPVIVGYLLAGVAVGPFTPGFIADAADRALLEQLNFAEARLLVIAIPDPLETRHIVEQAHRQQPGLPIIARTHSEEEAAYLRARGAEPVLAEHEAGLAMNRLALQRLGLEPGEERPEGVPEKQSVAGRPEAESDAPTIQCR